MNRVTPTTGKFKEGLSAACLTLLLMNSVLWFNPLAFIKQNKAYSYDMKLNWQKSYEPDSAPSPLKIYTEANPSVMDNQPDETNLISTQNQQAAQPSPVDKLNRNETLPESTGTSQNLKIVPRLEIKPSTDLPEPKESTITVPQKLPSSILPPKNSSGMPQEINDGWSEGPRKKEKDRKIINLSNQLPLDKSNRTTPQEDNPPVVQKTRPRLSLDLLNGPLLQKTTSAPRVGKLAVECRLNPYGVYMQAMLKSIERQWGELILDSYRYLQREQFPEKAMFRFTLLSNGQIKNLNQIGFNLTEQLSTELCRQAIASRSPFGIWTEKMIEEFGYSDEISITFNYK